jgi:alkanesulfonate monooxygenase SsuD/methylene tetrahydromethanopterin reductase-like flavin-dependent oxidoreductase (luciferase family)
MAGVEFGIFDHIDRQDRPLAATYEDRLRLLEAADELGYFCYHVAEHHATPLGMAPSPALFLAAAAQRTRRLRLGPLVLLLPLANPLRAIEDVCMLDHLSNGRLELGVGRGISPYELRYFDVDPDTSRALFHEGLDVLLAGLRGPRLTHDGPTYHLRDVPMALTPLQQPYPPIWYATHNIESVPWAAANGLNMVGLGPAAALRPNIDRYRELWAAHRDNPGRINPHVAEPKLGINRHVFVAPTDEEAHALARPAHEVWHDSFVHLWREHGDRRHDRGRSWETSLEQETIIIGSPDTVRGTVARILEQSGCSYLVCGFAWGSLTYEQSLRSMQLFAEHVMPAFRGSAAPVTAG